MATINDLPTEILLHLFQTLAHVSPNRLDYQHALNICSRVSRRWHAAASTLLYASPVLKTHWNWRRLLGAIVWDAQPPCRRAYTLGALVCNLDISRLWNVDIMDDVVEHDDPRDAAHRQTLPLSALGTGLTAASIETLCRRCPNLRSLSVHSCAQISAGVLDAILRECPFLTVLWLPGCFDRTTLRSGATRVDHDDAKCAFCRAHPIITRAPGPLDRPHPRSPSLFPSPSPSRNDGALAIRPPPSRQQHPSFAMTPSAFIVPPQSNLRVFVESIDASLTNPYVVRFIGRESAAGRRICRVSLDRQRRRKADEYATRAMFKEVAVRSEMVRLAESIAKPASPLMLPAGDSQLARDFFAKATTSVAQARTRGGMTIRIGELVAHVMYHRKSIAFGVVMWIAPRVEFGVRDVGGGVWGGVWGVVEAEREEEEANGRREAAEYGTYVSAPFSASKSYISHINAHASSPPHFSRRRPRPSRTLNPHQPPPPPAGGPLLARPLKPSARGIGPVPPPRARRWLGG
ncbi:hypothetical protein BC938DRAFT_480566 [Jimgerdemannia flammicorona]|uniref:F-box domain-containing protein n=1 Tax=Jimgerdemannia flammicorona TaxID=994334 RepID=A0A433QIB4_9FUNG|nr:hypothetical protein BC938DRAFT_480566 [Jimgerdemannia flammicorona]